MATKKGPATDNVYFVCQRCCQPLELHSSLNTLTSEELSTLIIPLVPEVGESSDALAEKVAKKAAAANDGVIRKTVARMRGASSSKSDFTMLTSPGQLKMDDLSYRLKVTSQLFDIMSGHGEIDHPLCQECTDIMMQQMQEQLATSELELETYRRFLDELEKKPLPDEDELQAELDKLVLLEEQRKRELDEVERERAQVAKDMADIKQEKERLELQEKQYLMELSEHQFQERALMDEQQSVDNQLQLAQSHLQTLEKTNIFNFCFHIWHQGHFATINGFRLGRLPTVPVEWNEINIAWGQAALLLSSLARHINLQFKDYRLVPYGNMSYIETLKDKRKQLPLYGSGGMKFFWDTKFDTAMVVFLELLNQLEQAVEARGYKKPLKFPYRMEGDRIGEVNPSPRHGKAEGDDGDARYKKYSIKTQFNSEEQWTKALKFLLTNLKWALAWVSV